MMADSPRLPRAPRAIAPPSRLLLLAEGRALWEAGAAVALWPLLQLAPRGDGHPVLVLPGLVATDMSTKLLRRYLQSRGYDAQGWGLGRNLGPRGGIEDGMVRKLEAMQAESGRKVSLIGWSLGGVYARLLASSRPELVRSVTTLGQKDLPALIEIRLGTEPPHHVRDLSGEVALIADLEQPDLTHHTLPRQCSFPFPWDDQMVAELRRADDPYPVVRRIDWRSTAPPLRQATSSARSSSIATGL